MTDQPARERAAPVFDRLDVFDDTVPHGAAFNMALDEVLLSHLQTIPLLRVYRWERPAVSFGYFTPLQSVSERYSERDHVRRWTGGGVVEHGDDVTYSVLVPRSHAVSNGPAGQSYLLIHRALQSALERLGWASVDLAAPPEAPSAVAAEACFARPVHHDLLSGGQKIGGGAQRRTRTGLLHQGSVRLPGTVALDATLFAAALGDALSNEHCTIAPPKTFVSAAHRLAVAKYATKEWLHRV